MNQMPSDKLSFTTFQTLVKSRFRVAVSPMRMVELELVEVESTGAVPTNKSTVPKHENFSLIFAGAAGDRLEQKTYQFSHEKIVSFDLFIVPIAAERGMIHYQAVFNRLLPAAE